MNRVNAVVVAFALTAVLLVVQVGASLYIDTRFCGADGFETPAEGSARSSYCNLFEDENDQVVILKAALYYGPVLLLVLAGAVAISRRSWRWLWGVAVVAYSGALLWLAVGALLPSA